MLVCIERKKGKSAPCAICFLLPPPLFPQALWSSECDAYLENFKMLPNVVVLTLALENTPSLNLLWMI